MAAKIRVIKTQKTELNKLSHNEIESLLFSSGLSEFKDIYIADADQQNMLATAFSRANYILMQPGLIFSPAKSASGLPFNLPVNTYINKNKVVIVPAGTDMYIGGVEAVKSNFSQECSWESIYDESLMEWVLGREMFYMSPWYLEKFVREHGYALRPPPPESKMQMQTKVENYLRGDDVKTLLAAGITPPAQNSGLLTLLLSTNQYVNFFNGEPLYIPESYNSIMMRQFINNTFEDAYMTQLLRLIRLIGAKVTVKPGQRLKDVASQLTAKQVKMLQARIAAEREPPNDCEHIKKLNLVQMGQLPPDTMKSYIETIADHKLICNKCGREMMCQHEWERLNGRGVSEYYYRVGEFDYCYVCGEVLVDHTQDSAPPQIDYDTKVVSMISYQYNLVLTRIRLGTLVSERDVRNRVIIGIYSAINAYMSGLDGVRGLSEMDKLDRIYLHTYIYIWIYVLYLIEMNGYDITILVNAEDKGKKLKNMEKIVMNIDIDMRYIVNRQPTLSVRQIFKDGALQYFTTNTIIEKVGGIKKENYIFTLNKLVNNPIINQDQFRPTKAVVEIADKLAVKSPPDMYELVKPVNQWQKFMIEATLKSDWNLPMDERTQERNAAITRAYGRVLLRPTRSLPILESSKFRYRIMPRTSIDEWKRKPAKYVYYLRDEKKLEIRDSGGMPPNSEVRDFLDSEGRSLLVFVGKPYEYDTSADKYTIVQADREFAPPSVDLPELDNEFVGGADPILYYIGCARGRTMKEIENGKAPQDWSMFRVGVILTHLSTYVIPKSKNKRATALVRAGCAREFDEETRCKICITATNMIIRDAAQLGYIAATQKMMTKPEIISYSLLKAYMERLDEPALDADDSPLEDDNVVSDDPYKNMDYDGENDEDGNE
jgi:hypothetical protein